MNKKETSAAPKEVGKADVQEGKEVRLSKKKMFAEAKRTFCTRGIKSFKRRKRDFSTGRVNDLSIV